MKKIILTCLTIGTSLAAAATLAQANSVSNKTVFNTRTVQAGSYKATVKGVVAHDAGNMTEFIPLYYLQQALKANGYGASWNGKTLEITTPSSVQVNLGNVKPGRGNTAITINGELLQNAPHIVAGDPFAHNNPTSYMPAYYLDKVLARAGFSDTYNGTQGNWNLTPPPVKANVTTLNSVIAAAQTALQNAVVANNPGDYAQSDVDTLNAAIRAAQAVVSSGTTSQATVDAAVQTLNNAVIAFEGTVIPGPVISDVTISSSNADPTVAQVGDTVTLTFTTQEQVSKLGTFKIDGNNPDSFTCTGSGNSWTSVATYTIQDSDPTGLVNFQINVKDNAGVYGVTTETTTDHSSVTVS